MNTKILEERLTSFHQWFKTNRTTAEQEKSEREQSADQVRSFTREKLSAMTEDDLFDYLSPLWAMAMWGNKHYQIDNIIEANGMEALRKHFSDLIYGPTPIEKRWDNFRTRLKGVGPAIMSELLCKTYPDEFLLWNKKTYNGFSALEIPDLPRYEARLSGKTYVHLSETGKRLVEEARKRKIAEVSNLLELNSFIWQELQNIPDDCRSLPNLQEELAGTTPKESVFIHNDIRDKVAEIGRCLGFRAEVEKKVADGAIVDAIWEVTIGNMGRVIYVFEVQTSGSIDSLILNLMKAKNNKAVQGIVAVTDQRQIEKIKRETAVLPIKEEIKFWGYTEVLKVHESLQFVNESINRLGLVPLGL